MKVGCAGLCCNYWCFAAFFNHGVAASSCLPDLQDDETGRLASCSLFIKAFQAMTDILRSHVIHFILFEDFYIELSLVMIDDQEVIYKHKPYHV